SMTRRKRATGALQIALQSPSVTGHQQATPPAQEIKTPGESVSRVQTKLPVGEAGLETAPGVTPREFKSPASAMPPLARIVAGRLRFSEERQRCCSEAVVPRRRRTRPS